jgi:hypothetical protein
VADPAQHRGRVRQLDPRWLQQPQPECHALGDLCKVIVPGVIGHVLTGVRLAIGILWIVLVPCEMLGVSAGLGYFILDTRDRLAYSELMAMVLLIGVLGFVLDALARGLHRRWVHAERPMGLLRGLARSRRYITGLGPYGNSCGRGHARDEPSDQCTVLRCRTHSWA